MLTKGGDRIRMQSDHEQVFCFVFFWKKKNHYCKKYLGMLNQGVVNSAVWNIVFMLIVLLWNIWLHGKMIF